MDAQTRVIIVKEFNKLMQAETPKEYRNFANPMSSSGYWNCFIWNTEMEQFLQEKGIAYNINDLDYFYNY